MSACMNCGEPANAGDGFCGSCSEMEQRAAYDRAAEKAYEADLEEQEAAYWRGREETADGRPAARCAGWAAAQA